MQNESDNIVRTDIDDDNDSSGFDVTNNLPDNDRTTTTADLDKHEWKWAKHNDDDDDESVVQDRSLVLV